MDATGASLGTVIALNGSSFGVPSLQASASVAPRASVNATSPASHIGARASRTTNGGGLTTDAPRLDRAAPAPCAARAQRDCTSGATDPNQEQPRNLSQQL